MNEIYPNIFQIQVILPKSPLKELNCYVIKGSERSLIIDSGYNVEEAEESLFNGLNELEIDLKKTDVFVTHFHEDHSALACKLKNKNNKAFISASDRQYIRNFGLIEYWESMLAVQKQIGFPEDQKLHYTSHPGYIGKPDKIIDYDIITPGEKLAVGDYIFTVLDLKGHTPGQLGLYEPTHKILFCGDCVLDRITPNINYWGPYLDCLGDFLGSLRMLRTLDIERAFTGHRKLSTNIYERIDQILAHHDKRLALSLEAIIKKKCTAFEVASQIEWDYLGGDFLKFPAEQKWFAGNEMLAHMQHLQFVYPEVKKEEIDEVFYYSVTESLKHKGMLNSLFK